MVAGCRRQAVRRVSVPAEVRQLLADLRSHLAEKVEPPVYISDRRLVKSVAFMQVPASLCPMSLQNDITSYQDLCDFHLESNSPQSH